MALKPPLIVPLKLVLRRSHRGWGSARRERSQLGVGEEGAVAVGGQRGGGGRGWGLVRRAGSARRGRSRLGVGEEGGVSEEGRVGDAVAEMARVTRRNIIRSNKEYLSEDHLGHNFCEQPYDKSDLNASTEQNQLDRYNTNEIIPQGHQQDDAASEFDPTSTGDPTHREGDIELNIEEETEKGTRHGKTKFKHV
ncbi:hypothetical protein GUJ93_ZPchr0012g20970 [Zizania palustris]|uniref:Uncharacterized protein n=1 Tax=Zizania palustris TaxID=103762 RepID=A0A8J6BST2_ZIZPA|nr:hypothetical protein GUJ93_ZPchr0012g20970 [Zizania palustris]